MKPKILIIDDAALNREILADMLSENYDILEADSGASGLALMQQHQTEIALVLLDIIMPSVDGFAVLSMMNEKGWLTDVPVIMISSELPEILGMSDRVAVMHQGEITGVFDNDGTLTQEKILYYATGGDKHTA
mgnify:CR=1 FL=1